MPRHFSLAEVATPEGLAAGRRTADGKFQEPEDDDDLITIELPQWPKNGLIVIDGPVAAIFEKHRAEHGQGIKVHPWDWHLLLIQLKVAAAGAITHGSVEVDIVAASVPLGHAGDRGTWVGHAVGRRGRDGRLGTTTQPPALKWCSKATETAGGTC